jgi:GNAT superfamily N-acetyltransferase
MEIRAATTPADFETLFPVIRELRPHLEYAQYTTLIREAAQRDQYQLFGAYQDNQCLGAMGVRILYDLVHGKHLYVDDLVTTEGARSQGIGARLLDHAHEIARTENCKLLRLSTGVENERGKKFYEREGWKLRSVTYKKPLG